MTMWLIVGGHGQLGKSLGDVLSACKIAYVNPGKDSVDITSMKSVSRYINQYSATVIVNAAAWTEVDDAEDDETSAYAVNCIGARNVALAARESGAQLIHISTDYVFSGTAISPIPESAPGVPLSAYGRTKLAGEQVVEEVYSSRSLIVRTAWLYSQYGANFARTITKRALDNQSVRVVNDQFGQPTSAVDLAFHLVDLVSYQVPPGIYHGTNTGETTWYEFARAIYGLCKKDPELVTAVPATDYPAKAVRPAYSVLGHAQTVRAGVKEMRNWHDALTNLMPQIISMIDEK